MSQTQDGTWTLYNPDKDNTKPCDSRKEAEEKKAELENTFDDITIEMYPPGDSPNGTDETTNGDSPDTVPCEHCGEGVTPSDAVYGPNNKPYHKDCENDTDGDERAEDNVGDDVAAEIVDHTGNTAEELHEENLQQAQPPAARSMQDPLSTLPAWMITEVSYSDRGDTTTTVNKRGCQVIASYLELEYDTTAVTRASETDFEYAEFRCVVEKPDGRTFTGHGTAKADGDDQNEGDGWKIDMLAETRAFKRAVKGATGGGIEAFARETNGV